MLPVLLLAATSACSPVAGPYTMQDRIGVERCMARQEMIEIYRSRQVLFQEFMADMADELEPGEVETIIRVYEKVLAKTEVPTIYTSPLPSSIPSALPSDQPIQSAGRVPGIMSVNRGSNNFTEQGKEDDDMAKAKKAKAKTKKTSKK